jgi:membrane protein DedA with SNARE-associated domain/rhodanese-related sulfurtransferase
MLLLAVLADQSGLPLPAAPFLIAAGALVRDGTLNGKLLYLLAVSASMVGHTAWYYAGRHRGLVVLRQVCRLSLEPDACMRRTQDIFAKLGPYSLIAVRFVPGLDTMAQPLAGMTGMKPLRYMALNLVGALLWVGSLLGVGYVFGEELESLVRPSLRLGAALVPLVGALLGLYVAYKLLKRTLTLLGAQTPRITVEELKAKMDAGTAPLVVDLRTALEARFYSRTVPGAIRLGRRSLDAYLHTVPLESEIVLFCNCPHEIYAARVALALIKKGRPNVRPLEGGLSAWLQRKYPEARLRGV